MVVHTQVSSKSQCSFVCYVKHYSFVTFRWFLKACISATIWPILYRAFVTNVNVWDHSRINHLLSHKYLYNLMIGLFYWNFSRFETGSCCIKFCDETCSLMIYLSVHPPTHSQKCVYDVLHAFWYVGWRWMFCSLILYFNCASTILPTQIELLLP